jgi:hypothetical protein
MNPRPLFAELKRRNVYKVAIAYGVVAWLSRPRSNFGRGPEGRTGRNPCAAERNPARFVGLFHRNKLRKTRCFFRRAVRDPNGIPSRLSGFAVLRINAISRR